MNTIRWISLVLQWASIVLALAVVVSTRLLRRRWLRSAHTLGWIEGRAALFSAQSEAQSRGLSVRDFMIAEVERDAQRARAAGFDVAINIEEGRQR